MPNVDGMGARVRFEPFVSSARDPQAALDASHGRSAARVSGIRASTRHAFHCFICLRKAHLYRVEHCALPAGALPGAHGRPGCHVRS